jgi:hypothetical protein
MSVVHTWWSRLALVAALAGCIIADARAASPRLFEWERGFGLRVAGEPTAEMFLWIYEWNMFDAMAQGQHTKGTYDLRRTHSADGTEAVVDAPQFQLILRAVADGAQLTLRVTNRTAHAWPEMAGIIPCWNTGQVPGTNPSMPKPANPHFADPWRRNTYYVSESGLTPLDSRAIHFNAALRAAADRAAESGRFAWSNKWPTSDENARAGFMVRESEDGRWVTAVAWEDFVSVQGHNPWYCLHNCVRVGPLRPGESRTVRGRLYLFPGNKEECLARFRRDFATR